MSEVNEIMRRLMEGIPPEGDQIDAIIKDIRSRRAKTIEAGSKAKSADDEALAEVLGIMSANDPKGTPLKRRA